jgi:stress response protein YsnF
VTPTHYIVIDAEGARAEIESLDAEQATIRLNNGQLASVPRSMLSAQTDGSHRVEFSLARFLQDGVVVIPVIEEQLDVGKREVEHVVRISRTVHAKDVVVDEVLRRENVEIERVPVNRYVENPVPVREENGTTIVSLVEEVLVVEKRLLLREEIRITRREETDKFHEVYTLHSEDVHVERDGEINPA